MKNKSVFISVVLGLGLVLALVWVVGGGSHVQAAPAGELHVCSSGCLYSSVQAAVDAAGPGDIIKVAQGTYSDVHHIASLDTATFTATQIVAITKSVTIQGGYTTTNWTTPYPVTQPTTLDAQGLGRVMVISGTITPTIEGMHITGGDAAGLGGVWVPNIWTGHFGGGIYVYQATAVISGNHVYSNTAPEGSGVVLYHSDATLTSNTIYNNATSDGGAAGIYMAYSPATLNDNVVHDNASAYGWGGGVALNNSDAMLNRNVIFDNTTRDYGGGISVSSSAATLTGNHVYSNAAGYRGGGIHVYNSYGVLLSGNIITGNTAERGGGIELDSGTPTLVNNVVADNQATLYGAGLYIVRSPARLLHTTVARNTGGDGSGVYVTDNGFGEYSTVAMTNTIIVDHAIGITVTAGSTATLNATLWHTNTTSWGGNVIHTNDHNGDPAFAPDGYHIGVDSLALDRGVDGGVKTDIDGDSRPQGAGYELGADEFPSAPPDVAWEKQIRVGDGAFQVWNSGPFTVAPGELVTIVERVWITGSGSISFTLGEAWTTALDWEGYDVTVGSVSQVGRTAAWSAPTAATDTWHVLTKTLRAVASPDYAGTLTETLTVAGLPLQLPERIVHFQQPRPQPAWEKTVRVNDGAPQPWDAGQFTVRDGDTLTLVDRVWVTHTADVTFTLAQVWGAGLTLTGQVYDAGTVVTGTGALTWQGNGKSAYEWHTLTTTLSVVGAGWLYESITETLTVDDAASQLSPRVVSMLNLSGVGDCHARINDSDTAYQTVQAAVDAAQPGDVVKLAGRCTAVNDQGGLAQIAYVTKGITLQGGYTVTNWTTPDPVANPTTLDALGRGRVLYIAGGIAPTIEGLRITGGDAAGLGGSPWGEEAGGGVYVRDATAVISGNFIYSNTTNEIGGGVYLHQSPSQLVHNIITSNTAQNYGGGLYLSSSAATLTENTITGNRAEQFGGGGGGFLRDSNNATLNGNTVSNNHAANGGGGLELRNSDATLSGNTVSSNTVNSQGGGLNLYFSNVTLSGNFFTGNTALQGGGLYIEGNVPMLVNNVVADNQATWLGSGIYVIRSSPRLLHTTIARNSGGDGSGVYVTDNGFDEYSTVVMTNTIVVGHGVGVTVTAGNTATLNATLWQANGTDRGGTGVINHSNDHSGDPAFAPDGYHLTSVSAAINRGVNAGVTTDVDGQTRPQDSGYDVGADEFVCVGLTAVTIIGPMTGTVGTVYTFTATVAPPEASPVISYTWDPAPAPGSLLLPDGSVTAYAWDAAGDYTITLTATNCGGADTTTHTIHVEPREQFIYLPLVLRNH